MKIIVSHDVDHLFLLEHWRDRFIPGLLYKSLKELLGRRLSISGFIDRFSLRLHRIDELITYNESRGIPSNFFFGMSNGLSLSYTMSKAAPIIRSLHHKDMFVGVHGLAFESVENMKMEKDSLERIIGGKVSGIRNHYLRQGAATKGLMKEVGYEFDSTDRGPGSPFQIDGLYEFPIGVMDVDVVRQGRDFDSIWNETMKQLEEYIVNGYEYFVVNFHDIYFSPAAYPMHYRWYTNLIEKLLREDYLFVDFPTALSELKG